MPNPPRKRYAPRLADDGLPLEMFQDVLRASHRWLLEHDRDYLHERISIDAWMEIHRIENPLRIDQERGQG